MTLKYIIKNRLDHNEQLELTLEEFKAKFKLELQTAINSYKAQEESKNFLPPIMKPTPNYESDFYFDLQWNFNHHAPTNYYVDRII